MSWFGAEMGGFYQFLGAVFLALFCCSFILAKTDKAMPSVTTDYAFINVIASLGWIVGIVLILSIMIYICRM